MNQMYLYRTEITRSRTIDQNVEHLLGHPVSREIALNLCGLVLKLEKAEIMFNVSPCTEPEESLYGKKKFSLIYFWK